MIASYAAIIGAALMIYAVTAGADFGAGLWDLVARGPRKEAHRSLIAHAIAPIWEANHVWLIFAIVLLFTVFPRGFAAVGIVLHIPLTAVLFGIVLRGAAVVFRSYGLEPPHRQRLWGRIFAGASLLTPIALGACVAALSSGEILWAHDRASSPPTAGWATPFGALVGIFALSLFAMLAAVYLCAEAEDGAVREDFRVRAIGAEIISGGLAALTFVGASVYARPLFENLAHSSWTWPVQLGTAALALATVVQLVRNRPRSARLTAAAQVASVVLGWGLAMDQHIILPGLPMAEAGTSATLHGPLLMVVVLGGIALVPSLILLFRVFKLQNK